MLAKLRPRSAYDVMAALALFLVVTGGTAFAVVAANQVNSQSIVNGQVKNEDLAPNSVGTGKIADGSIGNADLAPNSVGTGKVADNSLTGADINVNTLPGSEDWHDMDNVASTSCYGSHDTGFSFCSNNDGANRSEWHNRPNQSGEDYDGVGYYRDREGIVRLKGLAQCQDYGSSKFCNDSRLTIFYLPDGYRPSSQTFLPTLAGQNPGIGDHYLTIYPDGRVRADGSAALKDYVTLYGISFRCGPIGEDGCK
jgi:hypothetical protein